MQAMQRTEATNSGSDPTAAMTPTKESACNMQAMGAFDALPNEVLYMILAESLPARWRFCARPVCRLWKTVLDAAGDETTNRPRNEYHDRTLRRSMPNMPWKSLKKAGVARGCFHALACRWRRGAIVLASTIVEWARTRPDLWDHQPDALATRCMTWHRAPRSDIVKVLVASGREPLVRYAVGPLFLDRGCLYDMAQLEEQGRKTPLPHSVDVAEIIHAATPAGPATTALVVEALKPVPWREIVDPGWLTAGDCPDTFEPILRAWGVHARDDGRLCDLWNSVFWSGSVRIFTRLLEIVATDDVNTWNCCPARKAKPNRRARRREAARLLAARLNLTWGEVAETCFVDAVGRKRDCTRMLEAGRAILVGDLARRVVDEAWSCGCVANLQWCKDNVGLPPVTHDRLCKAAHQNVEFFEWLFDPRGGAHVPANDAEITRLFRMLASRNSTCALWVAERWPAQSAAAGVTKLAAMVDQVLLKCRLVSDYECKGRDSYGGLLERLVRVLDRCAPHAPPGDNPTGDCDLWASALALGRVERRRPWDVWHVIMCYMWARTTGNDDDAVDMLGGHGRWPTSSALWTRWCRVAPVSLVDLGLAGTDLSAVAPNESGESPLVVADRARNRGPIRNIKDDIPESRASTLALAVWLRSKGLLADHQANATPNTDKRM
ncbi:hypothetical protein psal_cds_1275 [Pandoravirus salinus]|uniref:F-box incomplete domain containing protein n=1 Tax=Pandoravirus salinus TaxID=1349410 RepID=A0A291ATS7_9VIRU|nr:hypothetical protein psal_cds_1275 [Pandoravirus salinus]ATE82301.1 hypothetical protein psal_cds_1275 [Pandoravirus salinus]